MAITWDATFEAAPTNSDIIGEGNEAIQDLKEAVRERLAREHVLDVMSGARHGAHIKGSAMVYVGTSDPTHLPDGSAVLTDDDIGRLWVNTTDMALYEYKGGVDGWVKLQATTTGITDKAVTLAKLADIVAYRIIGRVSATTGAPESLTPDNVKTVLRQGTDTAVVTNFNADLLDGQSGSYYQSASNLNSGIIPDARMPNLTGDVTTVEGTVATTLVNQKVTNAKLLNKTSAIASATAVTGNGVVLGRVTTGTGAIEDIVLDADSTLVDDSAYQIPTQRAVKAYVDAKSGSATTAADLSIKDDGTGTTAPTTFDGSAARTISYNNVGASPKSHASSATTYGLATASNYGHTKLYTAITNGVTDGAPNSNAVYDALVLKANLASPALTGTPTAPTAAAGTNTTQIATTAFVFAAVPAGSVTAFAGSSTPTGWLLCDGSQVSRSTYSVLFSAISTYYGGGDGSTTFNLPDMRESSIVGVGTYAAVAGTTHGTLNVHDVATLGEFKDDRMESHTHYRNPSGTSEQVGSYPGSIRYTGTSGAYQDASIGSVTGSIYSGRNGTTTRGKLIGMNYIIKY